MAIELTSPEFSFIQITEPSDGSCAWYGNLCLPVYELADLSFQIIATVSDADKETFQDETIYAQVIDDCPKDQPFNVYQNYNVEWTLTDEGVGYAPDTWVGNFQYNVANGFTELGSGDCFSLGIYKLPGSVGYPDLLACIETCFQKITDTCFTAQIGYRNNENSFDFDYSDQLYFNRVRLPFYLHSPTNPEEEKSYTKSDGSSVKLMHRIWKDYKVKTDYFHQSWVEKFTIATAHDGVYITDDYIGVTAAQFIRMEKVDTAWMEEQSPGINIAQSITTLRLASPRATINSNCE